MRRQISTKDVLSAIDIGSGFAQNTFKFPERLFIRTQAFEDLINEKVDILYGDRGTGKSSIYGYIRDYHKRIPQIRGINIISSTISNNSAVLQILTHGDIDIDQVSLFWEWYVISLVGNYILNGQYNNELTNLNRLMEDLNIRMKTDDSDVVLNNLWSILYKYLNISPDRGAFEKHEYLLHKLDNLLYMLRDITISLNIKIWILIDGIENLLNPNFAFGNTLAQSLFQTYRKISVFTNIKLKIFIRSDMISYDITRGIEDFDAIKERSRKILWSEESLQKLLTQKLGSSKKLMRFINSSHITIDEFFIRLFPMNVNHNHKTIELNWIFDHIRDGNNTITPRDLIKLVSKAIRNQIDKEGVKKRSISTGNPIIEFSSLESAYAEVSEEKTKYVLQRQLDSVRITIERFRGTQEKHNALTISKILNQSIEDSSYVISKLSELGFLKLEGTEYIIPPLYQSYLGIGSTNNFKAIYQSESSSGKMQKSSTKNPVQPSEKVTTASLKSKIDFGIISIRKDEYTAVLRRFPPQRFAEGKRVYSIHEWEQNDKTYRIATLPLTKQGHNEAQHATRDMIEDLDPKLFVLVGIAGGVPAREFTLGDVVVATSLTDFSIQAANQGGQTAYAATGAAMHPLLQAYLVQLPALKSSLKGWNTKRTIGFTPPQVYLVDDENFYGDEAWQSDVKKSLRYHFGTGTKTRNPTVVTGSIATSNQLMKDTELLTAWQQFARQTQAVEMELGGVYEAARDSLKEYPVLAIRGISDIVGFRRDDRWTEYACHSAAAFAAAIIRSGFLDRMIER